MQFPCPVMLPIRLAGNFRKPKAQYPVRTNMVAEKGLCFPSGKTTPTNILFQYLYRDASNYKQYGEAIFSNREFLPLDEIEKQIIASLRDGQYFIARQVQLEKRFFETLYEDDHPWHEFGGVEPTTLAPFDPENWAQKQHRRDITEFLADLDRAHKTGWTGADVWADLKDRPEQRKADL